MVSSAFEYFAPTTLAEAQSLLTRHGDDAKIVAGGHSLIPMMKLRLAQPKYLIDLGRVSDLSYIREQDGGLAIGAMTTYYQIESSTLVRDRYPALADAASLVADVQVRNKGTIGGSLAHADPAADLPAVVLALEGQISSGSSSGQRIIGAGEFFCGALRHCSECERNLDRGTHTVASLRHRQLLQEVRQQGLSLRRGRSRRCCDVGRGSVSEGPDRYYRSRAPSRQGRGVGEVP